MWLVNFEEACLMKKFIFALSLLVCTATTSYAGVVDRVLDKVLPPAPYTRPALLDLNAALKRVEKPIVGPGMTNKERVDTMLAYLRKPYSLVGYSLDASISKLAQDIVRAGGVAQFASQVGDDGMTDTPILLTMMYANVLTDLANDPLFVSYLPAKLVADLHVLNPSSFPNQKTQAPKATTPQAVTASVVPTSGWKPSFDCAKASTYSEKMVCEDTLLGKLDGALSESYQYMRRADIGEGAMGDLKKTQKAWLIERNKCTDKQCLIASYQKRIDAICEYPVISGIHPMCNSAEDVK